MKIEILFEDNHLLVVNKPAGRLAQGDRTGDPTVLTDLKQYLGEKYNKPGNVFLGLVHRLDRPVSGVLLLARTSKALTRLNSQFQTRMVQKTYWAIVNNLPEPHSNTMVHWLKKDTVKNKVTAYTQSIDGAKKAVLSYRLLAEQNNYFLLEINPETGRPHQIRVQLAKIGCPILGDLKYGSKVTNEDGNISLHAKNLVFEHPVRKERVEISAALPEVPPGTFSILCYKPPTVRSANSRCSELNLNYHELSV